MVLGCQLLSSTEDTLQGEGITYLFYHKGQAVGQCSIQAPDQTCSIHMQNSYIGWGKARDEGLGPMATP